MLCGGLPCKSMKLGEFNARLYSHHANKNQIKEYQQWQYRSIRHFRTDLPFWLDMVLSKATQADPTLCFQALSEFKADLEQSKASALVEYKSQPLLYQFD